MAIKFTVKTKTNIRFNGKDYESVDQMPPDVRQAFEKVMASLKDAPLKIHTSSAKIVFNGKEYAGVDEMPFLDRQLYERAMSAVDANRNGIPDAFETPSQAAGPGAAPRIEASRPSLGPNLDHFAPASPSRDLRLILLGVAIAVAVMSLVGLLAFSLFR